MVVVALIKIGEVITLHGHAQMLLDEGQAGDKSFRKRRHEEEEEDACEEGSFFFGFRIFVMD